jgi:hypothetical protein
MAGAEALSAATADTAAAPPLKRAITTDATATR